MQAVILVGGQGTRLRPLTLTTPKPLIPLANRPVIEHLVGWLAQYDVQEIILATQYQAAAFERWLRQWRGVPVRAIEEPEPRGTAGAVANVAAALHGTTVVANGDNVINLDLAAMHAAHMQNGAIATISTDAVDDPSGRGVVVSEADGRVIEFQEKPAPGTAKANTVNTGVYLLEPAAIAAIPRDRFVNFEQTVFPQLIANNVRIQAFQSRHLWIDTGTPAGYLNAQRAVLHGEVSRPGGEWVRAVWQDDSVTIDDDASIRGSVAIGFGTAIAAGATIADSSIGRECFVLGGAQIEGSAIWDGCQIEGGAIIRNSIIGHNCYVGSGARVDSAILGDGCIIRAQTIVYNRTLPT